MLQPYTHVACVCFSNICFNDVVFDLKIFYLGLEIATGSELTRIAPRATSARRSLHLQHCAVITILAQTGKTAQG